MSTRDGAPHQPEGRVDLLVRDFDRSTLVPLRHEVWRSAESSGLADLTLYRFVVAVNEIATNAVHHGGGAGRLELWRSGDLLHCRISDRGPGLPARYHRDAPRPPARAVNGRGLWLARHGVADFVVETGRHGTTITMTHRPDETASRAS
jgi:anti-sigma regulatory factor (Ser/Thr protein kinase)